MSKHIERKGKLRKLYLDTVHEILKRENRGRLWMYSPGVCKYRKKWRSIINRLL